MKHVLFDFDDTLDRTDVQAFAKHLMERDDVILWICTARTHAYAVNPTWNDDLYKVAEELNIPKSNVLITDGEAKHVFLKRINQDFIWLLDDDWETVDTLNDSDLDIVGIKSRFYSDWEKDCNQLIK